MLARTPSPRLRQSSSPAPVRSKQECTQLRQVSSLATMFQWRKFQFFDKETLQEEDGKDDLKSFQVIFSEFASQFTLRLTVKHRNSLRHAVRVVEEP